MNSPSSLLQQLRIDRDDACLPNPVAPWRQWIGVALIATVVVAFVVGWAAGKPRFVREPGHAQETTSSILPTAAPVSGPRSAPAALDASGYVVARRQATVS